MVCLTPKLIAMAKLAQKNGTAKRLRFEVVNPHAAGIDVSSREMQVCVPSCPDGNCNRTFGSYTCDLESIASWLHECGVETVAMESTGIYWLPVFGVLKDSGLDVVLVNARDVKNYSGRKTDASDAEWLMKLHQYGLLRPCFQPENIARQIRGLVRHRDGMLHAASREVLHMQKAMEQMNLKLDNVFSDILGKSGQAIIKAILGGERDPYRLSLLADRRCHKSPDEIVRSLQASWDEAHLFELQQSYSLYGYYQEMIAECDGKIEELTARYAGAGEKPEGECERSGKRIFKKNMVQFDVEKRAFELWGVNAMRIPGMSTASLLRLMGELGKDFCSKFPTVKHFVSWCNLVPNNKISGGALLSSKVPKKKSPVGQVFRQCANSLARTKSPLGDYFRHIRAKGGYLQAMVATGKKLATIFYFMVLRKEEYNETMYANQRKSKAEKEVAYLRRKLERMQMELCNCKFTNY